MDWLWQTNLLAIGPYTGLEEALGLLAACVGLEVNPYTNEPLNTGRTNPLLGERFASPFGRDLTQDSFTRSRTSLLSSPDLIASNGQLPSTGQTMTAEQVQAAIRDRPSERIEDANRRPWARFEVTINGQANYLYYSDTQGWYTTRAPDRVVDVATRSSEPPQASVMIGPPAPLASYPSARSPAPNVAASSASPVLPSAKQAAGTYDSTLATDALNSQLVQPPGVSQAPSAAPTAPDWKTQVEWTYPAVDRRLIQPITHYDSGNSVLNFVMSKIVLPSRNWLAFVENIGLATIYGIDDELKRYPEYQAAQDLFPLEGALGLAMEVGPAIEYGISHLPELSGIAKSIAYSSVTTSGLGGFGLTGRSGALRNLGPDVPVYGREIEATLSAAHEAPTLPSLATQREADMLFGDSVRRAERMVNADREIIVNLGGTHKGAPITDPQLYSATFKPPFARVLGGNAMEALVNQLNLMSRPLDAGFFQVGGAYRIDFKGFGRFEGLSYELTTEADVAAHLLRLYVQQPGARIFTYTLTLF